MRKKEKNRLIINTKEYINSIIKPKVYKKTILEEAFKAIIITLN
jgi:hypothetical protein